MITAIICASLGVFVGFWLGVAGVNALWRRAREREARERELEHSHCLRIGEDKYEMLAKWADLNGLSPDAWAARTLRDAIPAAIRKQSLARSQVVGQAFRALDQAERGARHELKPRNEVEMSLQKIEVTGHPCFHLSGEKPPNFTKDQCQGLCTHANQRGRVCFFAPAAAKHCEYFKAKVIPAQRKSA